jgi:hypothetical protein
MKSPAQMNIEELSALMGTLTKKDDCPASPICRAIGTIGRDCVSGGIIGANQSQYCLISIVTLLGYISGVTQKLLSPKKIEGFSHQGHKNSVSKRKTKSSSGA